MTKPDAVRAALVELVRLADTLEKAHNPTWDAAWNAARAALSEQPAPKTACKGIPRVGCNYLAECDSVCNKCGKVHAVHLIPGVGSTAPVERVTLSDEQIDKIFAAHLNGFVTAQDHRNAARVVIAEYERLSGISATPRQPLSDEQIGVLFQKRWKSQKRPLYSDEWFAAGVSDGVAEYGRLSGISATPRQPLSEAQIAAVLRKASERAGFVTLEAGEPSAFMVGVVRDVEAAHGITPAQGKETQG